MTRQENVDANIAAMRHVQEVEALPLGSEGGNAVAARGLAFAHGMQTPVIGWADPQMGAGPNGDPRSPFHVGPWYPSEQPAVFFRPVPLKNSYRTIHFDPRFRLPLYQAVFHDAIVTTHHWLYDSLKLTTVLEENELTRLLYNVPGLYHLSAATLSERLPGMLRQDAFFRPLHESLGLQALTRFEWLTADHRLQRTTFADGTRLVANFGSEPVMHGTTTYRAQSVTAVRPDGSVSDPFD